MRGAIAALTALVLLVVALEKFREQVACRSRMTVLLSRFVGDRLENGGHYPTNLISLVSFPPGSGTIDPNFLTCPGTGKGLQPLSAGTYAKPDYTYMNWESFFGTNTPPQGFPLFYDRRLRNHCGLGVNVVTTTGSFFDFRACWLRRFAARHPEYSLPIPD
jgi:hypothetical protein